MAVVNGIIRDKSSQTPTFTITNFVQRIALDANTATLEETSDTLATLIRELARQGLINADVTA